jgi:branched-chain amino acid transport system substrate-binding protein
MRQVVQVGILFSPTGSYAAVGEAMQAGALLAVEEVNADPSLPVAIEPVVRDPGGVTAHYVEAARAMLAEAGITQVVGCYTSSSRKEVLPLFEKHDALLWYPSHYEGFETSENIIYTGAGPNQHVLPLARWLLATGRRRAFFVGSNYIWAWENNRILREALTAAGGTVLGERYFPVGDTDLSGVIRQILRHRPDFVFNTLIGESAYGFYRDFRAAAAAEGIDQAAEMPVASCSLAEPELARLGEAAAGHLSSSVYFSTVRSPENAAFTAAWAARFPGLGHTSADAEASYVAVHLLARAFAAAGGTAFEAVRTAAAGLELAAPQGRVRIHPENRHCHLRPRIGRSTPTGTFELLWESAEAVRPDPYLVWESAPAAAGQPTLRIVS